MYAHIYVDIHRNLGTHVLPLAPPFGFPLGSPLGLPVGCVRILNHWASYKYIDHVKIIDLEFCSHPQIR